MDYTKSSGYVTDAHGRRQFVDRNDAAGVQGTFITESDLNGPQNEIISSIIRFGLTPSDESDDQLGLAMAVSGALSAWSQDIANEIGGYPQYAVVCDATGTRWLSLVPNNTTKPGTGDWINASGGRLLGVQTFTESGTYTPSAGVASIIVEVQGGGASGYGCNGQSSSTTCSVGSGGNAGTYAKGLISSPTVTLVTIGAQTDYGKNAASAEGNASSFGSLIVCPGGAGGSGAENVGGVWAQGVHSKISPVIDSVVKQITNLTDVVGGTGIALGITAGYGGCGANSMFGVGGGTSAPNADGDDGRGYGSGGAGTFSPQNGRACIGGRGAAGTVVVWEYS